MHQVTRRRILTGSMLTAAWVSSPARALLAQAAKTAAALPARVEKLFAAMTLEEKAGQLTLDAAAWGGTSATALNPPGAGGSFDAQLARARAGQLTGVFNGQGADMARQMQTVAVREARLPIPLMFAADVIHGFRTIFPVPLGEAASFDPDLAERTARVAATEAAAAGIDWTFAPMVDIAHDARWGRGVEGAGEDVHLGQMMAAARVRGFQGRSLRDDDSVMACAKHFAAYGAAESGLDYNAVDVSERSLRDIYFPPFQAAFGAGAGSVMVAFNELSGVPATGNHWLLSDVLRGEWGFGGVAVSDYTGDEEMIAAGYAADARDAARLAFLAGVDVSMQSDLYIRHLPDLVRTGAVPSSRLDEAVRRVLAAKVALGLFDDPFRRIAPDRERTRVLTPAHRALAREAGRRAIVMLKNDAGLLPLRRAGQRIALIGPFAAGQHDLVGAWNVYGSDEQAVDLATGVKAAVATPALVTVSSGAGVNAAIPGGIEAAVAAARAADIVVLAIGEGQDMSGEAKSRTAVVIPPAQQALAEAVAAIGKPMVVVLKNGRALALEGAVLAAPAILVTWFLGTETGPAIADVLFGATGPSGRLPVSFPHASGQEPYYYAHKATGRPNPPGPLEPYKTHYQGIVNSAAFPFGHGLTYGDIVYSDPTRTGASLAWDGTITIGATLTNRGARAADEVAQLYIHDVAASVTRPIRQLKAVRRVHLPAGGAARVSFDLSRRDLLFVGADNRPTVEPGAFRFWIAPSAEAEGVTGNFELIRG